MMTGEYHAKISKNSKNTEQYLKVTAVSYILITPITEAESDQKQVIVKKGYRVTWP